jgi:ribosomal-protein-alanine N-acetyltransferase
LPQVVALDRVCFGGLWTAEGYQREIDSSSSDLLVLCRVPPVQTGDERVAERARQDEIYPLVGVGCEWAIVDEAHVTLVGVHPSYQRQGFGAFLLWAVLMLGRHRGLEWATLEVRPSNQSARSLYDKFGFELVGQRRRYYSDTGEDALILWLKHLQRDEAGDRLQELGRQIHRRLTQQGWQFGHMNEPLRSLWAETVVGISENAHSSPLGIIWES